MLSFETFARVSGVVSSEAISFSVSPAHRRSYQNNRRLFFDAVSTNVGNHYDVSDKSFICPFHGIYGFLLSVDSSVDSMECAILKQNNIIGQVKVNKSGASAHASTTFAVTECRRGERVFVKTSRGSASGDVMAAPHTVFSGFLIIRLP